MSATSARMSTKHSGCRERKDVVYQNVSVDITPNFHQKGDRGVSFVQAKALYQELAIVIAIGMPGFVLFETFKIL